jgi:hypothetical protein
VSLGMLIVVMSVWTGGLRSGRLRDPFRGNHHVNMEVVIKQIWKFICVRGVL